MNHDDIEGLQSYVESAVEQALGRRAWVVDVELEQRYPEGRVWSGFDSFEKHYVPGIPELNMTIRLRLGGTE